MTRAPDKQYVSRWAGPNNVMAGGLKAFFPTSNLVGVGLSRYISTMSREPRATSPSREQHVLTACVNPVVSQGSPPVIR